MEPSELIEKLSQRASDSVNAQREAFVRECNADPATHTLCQYPSESGIGHFRYWIVMVPNAELCEPLLLEDAISRFPSRLIALKFTGVGELRISTHDHIYSPTQRSQT